MATKRVKASAKGSVKVTVTLTEGKVAKRNLKLKARQSKPMYTDQGAQALWASVATVAKGKLIPTDLRVATKGNAQARRQWCADNGATLVDVAEVCRKVGDRPDNALRARLETLGDVDGVAKSVGYVRAIDSATAKRDPEHALVTSVYLYRIK